MGMFVCRVSETREVLKWCFAVLLGLALFLLLPTPVAAAECQFVLGFKTLRDLIGHEIVGECLENEHHGANGDGLQQTTGGLLVWRKADNWTAFTDGYRSWINGPNGLEQRLNTEFFVWETESAIAALPWIDESPREADDLRNMALTSQPLFWVWMDLLKDGRTELLLPKPITSIARIDETAALRIVGMPFLKARGDVQDYRILFQLMQLARTNPDKLGQVLSHPRLHGGITDEHVATVVLLVLGVRFPEVAAAIEALPWVQDGIVSPPSGSTNTRSSHSTEYEEGVVLALARLVERSPGSTIALIGKPWVQDGVAFEDHRAIESYVGISHRDRAAARRVIDMPFLETLEKDDYHILEVLRRAITSVAGLRWTLTHPKLAGGINDDQLVTVSLLALEWQDPETTKVLRDLPWMSDGVDASEKPAALLMNRLARWSSRAFALLAAKPWARDALSADEQSVAESLLHLIPGGSSGERDAAALRILSMPFLDTVTGSDVAALVALSRLQNVNGKNYLQEVLSHPRFRDGIRDEQTAFVAVLDTVAWNDPQALGRYLTSGQGFVWHRTLRVSGFPDVELIVAFTSLEAAGNIDLLEHAMRSHMAFMGVPFPTAEVILWVHNRGGGGGGGSGRLTVGRYNSPSIVAHEAAHVYWPFPPLWIAEGGAVFLEQLAENARVGSPIRAFLDGKCRHARTLQEYDRLIEERRQQGQYASIGNCNHSLGSGLFVDLYHTLGDGWFREGFRKLYHKLRADQRRIECKGLERGACFLKATFVTDAPPQAAAAAERVINRWYYGSE